MERRKSFFLCVGAPKCGTTSLHYILDQHKEICLPRIKETNFFIFDDLYERGLTYYFKKYFDSCEHTKLLGEINPSYFAPEQTVERIFKTLGSDIKLIFMFRNPVDRAYSDYWMRVRRGLEKYTFLEAINREKERCDFSKIETRKFCYLSNGYYAKWLKSFLRFFPVENMFFILFELDFLQNREKTIQELLKFLNVEPNVSLNLDIKRNSASVQKVKWLRDLVFSDNWLKRGIKKIIKNREVRANLKNFVEKINSTPYIPPKLSEELKGEIIEKYFIEDIKSLESILKRDLSVWYTTTT